MRTIIYGVSNFYLDYATFIEIIIRYHGNHAVVIAGISKRNWQAS